MSDPSRPQIEAAVTKPTYTVEYWNGSAWTTIADAQVLGVSGASESAGGDNGIIFGCEATSSAQIQLDTASASIAWRRTRARVRFGFDTSNKLVRAAGLVTRRSVDTIGRPTWTLSGWEELIGRTPVYSPMFYRRPAATKTTATSIEDPTNGAYAAGIVNYAFWQAGGRPLEQAGTYTSAVFYYSCDTSLIAPEWSWIAGENAWAELGRVARACGMVIFQAADGTMRAQHALNLAGTGTYTFTRAVYKTISEDDQVGTMVAAVRCRYTTRRLQAQQVVYEDTTPRLLEPTGSLSLTLEMSQPVYDYVTSGGALPSDALVAATTEGNLRTIGATVVEASAGRMRLTLNNATGDVIVVSRIQIRGRPVAPVEEGMVVIGSGTPEREIGEDAGVLIQSRMHALQMAQLFYDFNSTSRPTRTLAECGYDPDRYVGEAVLVTDAVYGLSSHPHRITAIRHTKTGALMDVDVVPTDGLPTLNDVFVIGQTYSGGTTKKLSY